MFRVTYEIVTPESTENGDFEEIGFVDPQFHIQIPIGEINAKDWPDASLDWDIRAVEIFLGAHSMEDNGRWFTTLDATENYSTGAQTRYSLHPPQNITPSSYKRVADIFEWRRLN